MFLHTKLSRKLDSMTYNKINHKIEINIREKVYKFSCLFVFWKFMPKLYTNFSKISMLWKEMERQRLKVWIIQFLAKWLQGPSYNCSKSLLLSLLGSTHNYCTVWQHPSTVDVISTEIGSALTETLEKKYFSLNKGAYEPVILTFLISISAETLSCARRLFDARLSAM